MVLSKDVCKACRGVLGRRWTEENEKMWDTEGKTICPTKKGIVGTDRVHEACKHPAEHVAEMNRAKKES